MEYASKGVAGTGLGLGIAGTALGLLNNGGLGLGGIGGLLGSGSAAGTALGVIAEKDAKIAKLEAENYSDKVGKEVYAQSLADNRATEARINALLAPVAAAIARMNGRIDAVAQAATCGIQQNSAAIAALQALVGKITSTVVPIESVCPTPMPQHNSWTAPTSTTTATA